MLGALPLLYRIDAFILCWPSVSCFVPPVVDCNRTSRGNLWRGELQAGAAAERQLNELEGGRPYACPNGLPFGRDDYCAAASSMLRYPRDAPAGSVELHLPP